jgi:hypothetical protein
LDAVTAAVDGAFSLNIGAGHSYLTATATDVDGTTSEFSNSLFVGTYSYIYMPIILNSTDQP